MNYQYVKVFGERNTGTNWMEKILRVNTDLEVLSGAVPSDWDEPVKEELATRKKQDAELLKEWVIEGLLKEHYPEWFGWKHQRVDWFDLLRVNPEKFEQTLFVCIVRCPYKWISSLYRRPYSAVFVDKPLPAKEGWEGLADFIRTPWLCLDRDNLSETLLESPADLWWRKALSLRGDWPNQILIRYEDLIEEPEAFFEILSEKAVRLKSDRYRFASTKGDPLRYNQYLKETRSRSYLQHFSDSDFAYLRRFFDRASWFGYEVL